MRRAAAWRQQQSFAQMMPPPIMLPFQGPNPLLVQPGYVMTPQGLWQPAPPPLGYQGLYPAPPPLAEAKATAVPVQDVPVALPSAQAPVPLPREAPPRCVEVPEPVPAVPPPVADVHMQADDDDHLGDDLADIWPREVHGPVYDQDHWLSAPVASSVPTPAFEPALPVAAAPIDETLCDITYNTIPVVGGGLTNQAVTESPMELESMD